MAPTGYQSQRASRAERQPCTWIPRDSGSQWGRSRSRSVWLRRLMLCCRGELLSWVDCQVALISPSGAGQSVTYRKCKHCILSSLSPFLEWCVDFKMTSAKLSQLYHRPLESQVLWVQCMWLFLLDLLPKLTVNRWKLSVFDLFNSPYLFKIVTSLFLLVKGVFIINQMFLMPSSNTHQSAVNQNDTSLLNRGVILTGTLYILFVHSITSNVKVVCAWWLWDT